MIRFLARIFYVVLIIIEFLVTLRFVFYLIDANPENIIVSTVYDFSDIFVSLFHGIIASPWEVGRFTVDVDALVTLVFCMLVGFVTVEIMRVFSPRLEGK